MSLSGYFKQRVPLKGRHMISFTVNEVTCLMSRNSLPSPPPPPPPEMSNHTAVRLMFVLDPIVR